MKSEGATSFRGSIRILLFHSTNTTTRSIQCEFRSLRVLNERHCGARGKASACIRTVTDMEILTWILDGSLEHRDNMGTSAVIRPGELQHMTAGTGVMHSEFNPSPKVPVHLLQIWIVPERKGLKPAYEQLAFSDSELRGKFHLVAGPEAPITIRQDADLYIARLDAGTEAAHVLKSGRHAWVQIARGKVVLNGKALKSGDGVALSNEFEVRVKAAEASEVLLFDLA